MTQKTDDEKARKTLKKQEIVRLTCPPFSWVAKKMSVDSGVVFSAGLHRGTVCDLLQVNSTRNSEIYLSGNYD